MIIDGKSIANEVLDYLNVRVKKLNEKGIIPTLQIILIGNNPGSESYVKQKKLRGEEIGAQVNVMNLSPEVSTKDLLKIINRLNNDSSIHGVIVQRPLPPQIETKVIDEAVIPQKDVDGFNPNSKFNPPLGKAIIAILENVFKESSFIINIESSPDQKNLFHSWLVSKEIVVVGNGETGGKPVIKTLQKMQYSLDSANIIDSKTKQPDIITKKADIIISAVGKPNVIKPEMIKKNVILISIGLSKGNDGKLHGDYNEEEIKNIASFYTPTPGGVGPVNVACLLSNLVESAESISS